MEYRQFRKTDEISLLGFGCMRLPVLKNDPTQIDDQSAFEMMDYALSNGVNYIDTAYMYHDGKSELLVSRALKEYPRESYYLADKLPLWAVKTIEDVERIFNEQLQKCGVEYFDNYLMHAMTKDRFETALKLGIYDKLREYQKQGKIKHIGFSFHDSPEVLEWMLNTYEWEFVQIQLNYLDWDLQNAKKQYELIEAKGIPCIIMEPIRGGALASLCPEANKLLTDFAPEHSIASWAIRYAASLPNVLTVLSGMSNFDNVKDNIHTMQPFTPLSDKEREVLAAAKDIYLNMQTIPCTACRYCTDYCPRGIDIPGTFKIWNDYALSNDKESAQEALKTIAPEKRMENCIECGVCTTHCPQSIAIPIELKKAIGKLK